MGRRKQRKRVLMACEGASERGYGRWLQNRLDVLGLYIHLDVWLPGRGGGDYLSLVNEAKEKIKIERKKGRAYHTSSILLDTTQKGDNARRDHEADSIVREIGIFAIWQNPDHEAFLLRHLPECETLRPAVGRTMRELIRAMPSYKKGMTALELDRELDDECLRRSYGVEKDFEIFLNKIGCKFT